VKLTKLRPSHPLLPVGIREIAFFETVKQGEGMFEVLGLGELLGLGVLDASLHESGKSLVVVFIPTSTGLSEPSGLQYRDNGS
jgi:hypothetical protein